MKRDYGKSQGRQKPDLFSEKHFPYSVYRDYSQPPKYGGKNTRNVIEHDCVIPHDRKYPDHEILNVILDRQFSHPRESFINKIICVHKKVRPVKMSGVWIESYSESGLYYRRFVRMKNKREPVAYSGQS